MTLISELCDTLITSSKTKKGKMTAECSQEVKYVTNDGQIEVKREPIA